MIRVASVPAAHPFVRHIQPPGSAGFLTLPEIFHEPGRWWPPRRLDPRWLRENAGSFDVLHAHFGYESLSVDVVRSAVRALAEIGRPLVVTVHDLQNPHLPDDADHLEQVGALVRAAAEVTTLTAGAAREIADRWGRTARVLAHPHIVPLEDLPTKPPAGNRVGVHLGDLRSRVAIEPVSTELRSIGSFAPVTVDVQTDAWESADAATRNNIESIGADQLLVHERLSDDELYDAVRRTRVQVLPYRRGTHSGWLEMCLDLGVAVAVPRIGYLAQQHPDHPLVATYELGSPGSLTAAVRSLIDAEPECAGWRDFRRAQRQRLSSEYAAVYRSVVAVAV